MGLITETEVFNVDSHCQWLHNDQMWILNVRKLRSLHWFYLSDLEIPSSTDGNGLLIAYRITNQLCLHCYIL